MRKTVILGVKNNNVVNGEYEITKRNGYEEFTASFSMGELFNIEDVDEEYKQSYFEELWNCMDADAKLNYLDDGDKTKQDVFEEWNYDEDYHNIKDCSCTDYELEKDGVTFNFETTSCGQYDIREADDFQDMIFTNKEGFELLMKLWDNYHLKDITNNEEFKKDFEKMDKLLTDYEEYEEKAENFIINNVEV